MPMTWAPGESHSPEQNRSVALVAATAMSAPRIAFPQYRQARLESELARHALGEGAPMLGRRRKHLQLPERGRRRPGLDLRRGLLARAEHPERALLRAPDISPPRRSSRRRAAPRRRGRARCRAARWSPRPRPARSRRNRRETRGAPDRPSPAWPCARRRRAAR